MKIKKVEELNENFEKNIHEKNDKIQKFKYLINRIWITSHMGKATAEEQENFEDFWDEFGDKTIQQFGLLEEKPKQGNIREILPQMAQKSNNSQITQQTAQRIVDKFSPAELNDFKRWLQLIK